MPIGTQIVWLLVLAGPTACVAWTVTHEELFAEVRDWCQDRSRHARSAVARKWFYLFTCEYCFSHYVAAAVVWLSELRLLLPGWGGLLLTWLSLVWVANVYMSLFGRLRLDIKRERVEVAAEEERLPRLAKRTR